MTSENDKTMKANKIYILIITLSCSFSGFTQTADQAKELYKKGAFAQAKPYFAQQIKAHPKDANINQWYGVCLFETGEQANAEKYLLVAAQKAIPEAYRYLGEFYLKYYRFEEAVEQLSKYIALPIISPESIATYNKKLKQAETAMRLIKGIVKVEIIDSLVVNKDNFFQQYKLSPESGTIRKYDSHFGTDTKSFASVYENERKDRIYFASKSSKGDYDIYTSDKLLDSWSEKNSLSNAVNTPENENFPFLLSDGTTLYFASDGEGSIGGYDIFVTRYNLAENTYLTPENLGMPFNSTANDYMLAIDEQNQIGWFASDRNQPSGKVAIYLFLPREEKVVYDNLSPSQIVSLAKINSIKESWTANQKNYKEILQRISKPAETAVIQDVAKGEFIFVLNDNRILRSLSDCKNAESAKLLNSWLTIKAQYQNQSESLEKLRRDYRLSNEKTRKSLTDSILSKEKSLDEQRIKLNELEVKLRKMENNTTNK